MASVVVRQVRCGIAEGGEHNCVLAPDPVASQRRRAAAPDMFEWHLATLPVEVDAA